MGSSLWRFLDLRPGEGWTFAALVGFMLPWGFCAAIGGATTEALFVRQCGAGALPMVFIASDLAVALCALTYSRLSHRVSARGLFRLILASNVGLAALLQWPAWRLAGPGRGILTAALLYVCYWVHLQVGWLHFKNLQLRCLDLQQAKRLLPRVFAGYSVGFIAGGLAIPLLLRWMSTWGLVTVWNVGLLGLLFWTEWILRKLAVAAGRAAVARQSVAGRFQDVTAHRIALWMLTFFALSFLAMRTFEFEANLVFAARFPDTEELTAFYGAFGAAARLLGLALQLLVVPVCTARLGLPLTALIYPVFTFLTGLAMMASLSMGPAVLARFSHTTLVYAVGDPVLILLAGGLPGPVSDGVRVLISAVITPTATCAINLLLLHLNQSAVAGGLGQIAFALGTVLLLATIPLRRLYADSILESLRAQGSRHDLAGMKRLPGDLLEELTGALEQPDAAGRELAVDLLARCRDPKAHELLLKFFRTGGWPELRARALRSLAPDGSEAARRLHEEARAPLDRAAELRLSGGASSAAPPEATRPGLASESLAESDEAGVLAGLATGRLDPTARHLEVYRRALTHAEAAVRLTAVQALRVVDSAGAAVALLDSLEGPRPDVARVALSSLGEMGSETTGPLRARVTARTLSPVLRHRLLELSFARGDLDGLRLAGRTWLSEAHALAALHHCLAGLRLPGPAAQLLQSTLEEGVRHAVLLCSHAIALLVEPTVFLQIRPGLSPKAGRLQQGRALEALLNLGESELTPALVRFLQASGEDRAALAASRVSLTLHDAADLQSALVQRGDPLPLATWLLLLTQAPGRGLPEPAAACATHPHPLVRELFHRTGDNGMALTTIEKMLLLRDVETFRSLETDELFLLGQIAQEVLLPAGKVLFREDEPGGQLYVLVRGTVCIEKGQGEKALHVADLGPGEILGELGLFDGAARSATARVTADSTQLLALEVGNFAGLLERHGTLALTFLRELARRLRATLELAQGPGARPLG